MAAGHYPAEVGRGMEDAFVDLLYRLGYAVSVRCDQRTSLDVIASFYGQPIEPKSTYPCLLLPPFFAPIGVTAFSLKRNRFVKKDVKELIASVQKARKLTDAPFSSINGMVIACNFSLMESELDALLQQQVYCWDGRRLIFYSSKVQTAQMLSSRGPVVEKMVPDVKQTSCLIEIETSDKVKNFLNANVAVFIDNHDKDLTIGSEHVNNILNFIHKELLKTFDQTSFEIQLSLSLHALGIVNEKVARSAHKTYSDDANSGKKVFFPADLAIFQYGAAPWSVLLR